MYARLPLLQYTECPCPSTSTKSRGAADGVTGAPKARDAKGISSLAGLFLFKRELVGEVDDEETEVEGESEKPIGDLKRRKAEEGGEGGA